MRKKKPILLQVNIIVQNDEKPHIILRRKIYDNDTIRLLIECALNEKPVIIMPAFFNKIRSISSLLDNGILSYDPESGQYEYNI